MLPDATVRYADHDDAVIDLHLPVTPDGRVLVLVHGGFWKAAYDRRHTRPMARALADLGWLVATPEYRRVGIGGGWPVTTDDVHLAVERLPSLLTGLGVPTGPVTVTGHSAGGHLALWLACSSRLSLERVVGLAPVCDLRSAMGQGLGSDATQAFLAGADPDPADPMALFSTRPSAPVAIVHGDADDAVPVGLSRGFVAAHPWVDLHELPGVGHMELIDPGSAAWATVVSALDG
ncbi:MAG: alpha/beta hydrolase [Marmoricola sp.]|jgi:acetyl esterase/lipase|nr:alpha/beta hydrolase [Marmoricola sp.]